VAEPAALIGVSVFREPGFAVPGAEVQLSATPSGQPAPKMKKIKGVSNARGEFVFRVPPGPMQYTVSVSVKGLKPQAKAVSVQGEERVDVTFTLERESK
jgi:Carboxypeptidase regulatory-like domain